MAREHLLVQSSVPLLPTPSISLSSPRPHGGLEEEDIHDPLFRSVPILRIPRPRPSPLRLAECRRRSRHVGLASQIKKIERASWPAGGETPGGSIPLWLLTWHVDISEKTVRLLTMLVVRLGIGEGENLILLYIQISKGCGKYGHIQK